MRIRVQSQSTRARVDLQRRSLLSLAEAYALVIPQRPALIASLLTVGLLAASAAAAVAWVERTERPPLPAEHRALFAESRDVDEPVRIAGSGSNLPLTQVLAQAYSRRFPDARVDVLSSIGSGGGVRALEDGVIDIALVSRPMREGELRDFREIRYARTQIVVATRLDLSGLTMDLETLNAVYRGELDRTPRGERLVPVLREAGDSTFAALTALDEGFAETLEEAQGQERFRRVLTDQAMEHVLSTADGTLGLLDAGFVFAHPHSGLRGVPIATQGGSEYPYTKDLAFVVRPSSRPEVDAFIRFVQSEEGRVLIRAAQYLPLPPRAR